MKKTLQVLKSINSLKTVSIKNDVLRVELGNTAPFTVFETLHKEGIEVRTFKEERKTLEEIFIEVTENESAA